jgi:hypothetical protein
VPSDTAERSEWKTGIAVGNEEPEPAFSLDVVRRFATVEPAPFRLRKRKWNEIFSGREIASNFAWRAAQR